MKFSFFCESCMDKFISLRNVLNFYSKRVVLPTGWVVLMSDLPFFYMTLAMQVNHKFSQDTAKFLRDMNCHSLTYFYKRSEAAAIFFAMLKNYTGDIDVYSVGKNNQPIKNIGLMPSVLDALERVSLEYDFKYQLAICGSSLYSKNFLLDKHDEILNSSGFSVFQLKKIINKKIIPNIFDDVIEEGVLFSIVGSCVDDGCDPCPEVNFEENVVPCQVEFNIKSSYSGRAEAIGDKDHFDKILAIAREVDADNKIKIDNSVAEDFGVMVNFIDGRFGKGRSSRCTQYIGKFLDGYLGRRINFSDEEVVIFLRELAKSEESLFFLKRNKLHYKDEQMGEIDLHGKLLTSRIKNLRKNDRLRLAVEKAKSSLLVDSHSPILLVGNVLTESAE